MAGHSKWAQIKRQKGAADQKRGATFSRLANAISIAARGGANPETNFQLRLAIEQAKRANMPKENIQRAIDKATGASGETKLEEVVFEAYGPGGTAFMIEAATDNRNRTVSEIRATLSKFGSKLADAGSVGYLFKKRGVVVVESNDVEKVELATIEAGAEDFEADDSRVLIYTDPKTLEDVRQNLAGRGFEASEVSLELHPSSTVPVADPEVAKKVIQLSEALDELDDVVNVASNFDVPAELVK